jgi:PAS domain S-box-containing protein
MTSIAKLSLEDRMRMVDEQLPKRALITLDPEGIIVDWNYGAHQLFGWTAEETVGKAASILFPPEDVSAGVLGKELNQAQEAGRASETRWHIRKDGARFLGEGVLTALRQEDGAVAGYVKVLREATTTFQIHESEAKFRAMVNATPHMVWSALGNGYGDYFNERFVAFTGVGVERLRGNGWAQLVHPEDHAMAWEAWCRAVQTETSLNAEFRFQHHSGQYRWVLCRGEPVLDDFGRVTRWMGTNTDIHDQKVAQEMLVESEELFRSLVTATSQVVWRTKGNGEAIFDSPTWRAFTGQSLEDSKGTGWLAAIHPLDQERAAGAWSEAMQERACYESEYRVWHTSGEYRWMQVRAVPLLNTDGSVREWVGTNTDITEKKRTELALHEARLRTDAILNAGDIGTWMLDLVANRIYGDANLARLFGVTQDGEDGSSPEVYFNALHPEDVGLARQRVAHAIATGEPYQEIYRVRAQDGGWRVLHVRGKVEYAKDGTPLWLPGVALDVTALKAAEEELRRREERYRTLFNSIDEGFYIVELIYGDQGSPVDYRFLEANPAATRHNGLENVIGKTLRDLVPSPRLDWIELYDKVVRSGESARFIDHSSSMGKWFDVSVSPVGEAASHQVALLFSDITERKKSEDELQRLASNLAQVNQRQSEFLATLAHELRNPLAPLRTGLDLVRTGMEVTPALSRVHEMMDRQVKNLAHLVDDLLDMARINSGKIRLKKTRHPLGDIVRDAIEVSMPVIQAKHHEVATQFPAEIIWIDADASRLGQVISNLLTNAAKYTPEGGKISLSVRREKDEAIVAVADNGIGIAAEDLPHLFEMFSQIGHGQEETQGGLGIGLNLVKRLTEKHGGTVTAASPGRGMGSTFTLRLPIAQRDTDLLPAIGSKPSDMTVTDSLRIVVADDNADAATMIKELLEINGHEVRMARNGVEALHAVSQFQPDLVLLDIGMPVMNGYEVAKAVRNDPAMANVTLAAVTGWSADEDRIESKEAGFDYHLTKPVTFDGLLELISRIQQG